MRATVVDRVECELSQREGYIPGSEMGEKSTQMMGSMLATSWTVVTVIYWGKKKI